ncbi:cellulose biosynthesis regulator YedQ [Cupriavidus necator]|uniref:diguanylate cyclase n=1 Tax=Cupriavidus necator TaxID=106590 RepID=UPI00148FBBC7|nr:diguanylate cyclase [Cupriavidus necator]NOV23252.1 cellulose biosynthesis regulator YedQ [Cupriavidus necator]
MTSPLDTPAATHDALPSALWRALAGHPRRFVLVSFGLALALLLGMLWWGLLLAQGRELESLRQMQALRAGSIDALLHLEAQRLLSLRNFAEHLLALPRHLPRPTDADLRSAFSRRHDPVWAVASRDTASVYGFGPEQLHAMPGFARHDETLLAEMTVARGLSHLLSAAPKDPAFQRRMTWISSNGLIVTAPPVPQQDAVALLRRYGAAAAFRQGPTANVADDHLRWEVAAATAEPDDISLFLSVPVYTEKMLLGIAMLEIPRSSLDDYLGAAPYHELASYLTDRNGKLLAASTRRVRPGESLHAALAGNWPPGALTAIIASASGLEADGSGHQLLVRSIARGNLRMVDEVSTRKLLAASAARLGGVVGAAALALVILLGITLAIVHTLFKHYQARGEALRSLAETDALTGLANRRTFAHRFDAWAAQGKHRHMPLSVILLDIDHFKKINDHWGHASGDAVLRALSDALRGNVRKDDLPARLGGEEFAVLLPGTDIDSAAAVAEQLRLILQALRCRPAEDARLMKDIRFTASFGVAEMQADHASARDALVMIADQRLYAAKTGGRNRVVSRRPADGSNEEARTSGLHGETCQTENGRR